MEELLNSSGRLFDTVFDYRCIFAWSAQLASTTLIGLQIVNRVNFLIHPASNLRADGVDSM